MSADDGEDDSDYLDLPASEPDAASTGAAADSADGLSDSRSCRVGSALPSSFATEPLTSRSA